MPQLNRCMLEDFDVIEFEEMWAKMIIDFKLEENNWLKEFYGEDVCGQLPTLEAVSLQVEGLHHVVKRFIAILGNSSTQRYLCLNFLNSFKDVYLIFGIGKLKLTLNLIMVMSPLMNFCSLEHLTSSLFTKKVFFHFRPMLVRASLMRVIEFHEMATWNIYYVMKYKG